MRQVRNSLVHTISKHHRFAAPEVLKWVLRIKSEVFPTKPWTAVRLDYLETARPGSAFSSEYGWESRVARELRAAIDALAPADVLSLLGIHKKTRFYYCPACHIRDFGLERHVKTAQLKQGAGESTAIFCFACYQETPVQRTRCTKCRGNVIDEETNCLSCGHLENAGFHGEFLPFHQD